MTALKRLLRDPLIHFLTAGALLFIVFRALNGPEVGAAADDRTIAVDQRSLVTFMQYRSSAFRPDHFAAEFAALPPERKQQLIDEFVREEALVREAMAMGLADGDYVIRRRMVQKMLYLLDDTATDSFAPSEAALREYFLTHQDRYRVAPTMTFTHVFVDREIRRAESAASRARRLSRELQSMRAGFDDAPRFGDRFPYLQNYVKRSPDFIESQLGPAFTAALASLEPSDHWQGPIESDYGYHLVLLTQREAARVPEFSDVEDQVRGDLLRDTVAASRKTAIEDLTKRFKVELR